MSYVLLFSSLVLPASALDIKQNYEDNVEVRSGDSVDLVCTASVKPKFCAFITPQNVVRSLGDGAQ